MKAQQPEDRNAQRQRNPREGHALSRRTVLKAAGVSGVTGLAGCISGVTGGGENSVKIGVLEPFSGVLSEDAEDIRRALKLAKKQIEADGPYDTVELLFADTEMDTGAAVQKAQSFVREDEVDFLFGNIIDPVFNAVSESVAKREEILYIGQAGNIDASGKNCNQYSFVMTESIASFCEASLGYTLKHGVGDGKRVYQIYMDYLYPQHLSMWNRDTVIPNYGGEHLGRTPVPFGTTDFSSPLTKAKNSGADVVFFGATGSNLTGMLNQAQEFGFFEEGITVCAPQVSTRDAEAMPSDILSYDRGIWAMSWYHEHDAPGVDAYVSAYKDEYGFPPSLQTAYNYATFNTLLQSSAAAGTTEASAVRSELVDTEWTPQLWGVGEHFRQCNQRSTHRSLTAKGRPADEINEDERNYFELVTDWENPDRFLIPCEQTGCELPPLSG